MNTVGTLLFLAALPVAVVGYAFLDRWHQRRAWREATRAASEIMGLERSWGPNARKEGWSSSQKPSATPDLHSEERQ